jgi:hypothetical protein
MHILLAIKVKREEVLKYISLAYLPCKCSSNQEHQDTCLLEPKEYSILILSKPDYKGGAPMVYVS